MNLKVERVDVWAAGIKDQPGALAQVFTALRDAGANLEFVIARRAPEKPGTGVVFLAPLSGEKVLSAAAGLGFNVANSLNTVRVEGKNEAGVGALLTSKLATAGISLRGFSAAVSGKKFIVYINLDSAADAENAVKILQQA
ncbi:MAG: ACT domain-containing protein [Planctomycetota bacterium]